MRRHRFEKGPLVTSLPELVAGIFEGHWFFLNDKPQNQAWLQNMNLRTLKQYVDHQRICYAIRFQEEVSANG